MAGRGARRGVLTPALGYIRVSKANEDTTLSPDIQRTAINAWAAREGRQIIDWLDDLNRTGREFARRKITEGIQRIEAGEAAEIVVFRFDRWGRNASDSLANIARVEKVGGFVRSATEPFDAETAIGKYTRTNALALAEMQSDIIGENWRGVVAHRYGRGLPHSGRARFGYVYTGGAYQPDPATRDLVAALYQRRVAGEPFRDLAAWLNRHGYTTVYGRPWAEESVRGWMDTGFPAGLIREGGDRHRKRPVVFHPGAHEALIDAQTWAAYRAQRAHAAAAAPARRRPSRYRLTGLLVCGHCGSPVKQTSRDGNYLLCSRHASTRGCTPLAATRAGAEAFVRAWLAEEQSTPEQNAALVAAQRVAARNHRARTDRDALQKERDDLDRELLRLLDGWSRGVITDETSYRTLSAQKVARQAEIDRALQTPAPTPALDPVVIETVLAAWDTAAADRVNAALVNVVGAVIVRRDGMRVVPAWDIRSIL